MRDYGSAGIMLSILVMDFGYTEEPAYGRPPMRHQIAWQYCIGCIEHEDMSELIAELDHQASVDRNRVRR